MVFPPQSCSLNEKFATGTGVAVGFLHDSSVMKMKEPKSCNRDEIRVLVVDADQDFRRYVMDCIEAEGISCITATSIAEALEALARNKISVLLVDWFLDHVATEVVRTARSTSALMPIIVMSGKPYNVKMDALLADADEFLEKSLGGSALANRVKRWIGRLDAAPDVFLPQREQGIVLLDEVKYRYIQHVVQLVGNNISLAAQKLGVHRQTISAAMATDDLQEGKNYNGAEAIKLSTTRAGIQTNDRE